MSYIVQTIGGLHTSTLTRFSTEQALELTALPGGIKSSEQAKVFLAALGLPLVQLTQLESGRDLVRVRLVCGRCGGSGRYSFNYTHGNRCFGCMGSTPSHESWQPLVRETEQLRKRMRDRALRALRASRKIEQALAQAEQQAQAWLESSPYELPLDQWEGGRLDARDQRTLADLWQAIGKWGQPTEPQAALIGRLAAKAAAEVEVLVPPAEGRYTVEGELVSIRESFDQWGSKVRGTVKVMSSEGVTLYHMTVPRSTYEGWTVGDTVGVTVTVQLSSDGTCGWGKRPSKPYRVAQA